MNLREITFPLSEGESRSLYSRLGKLGARVFTSLSYKGFDRWNDEDVLTVAGEQSRFDYRLLYVLVEFIAQHFSSFHPFKLRKAIQQMKTPAVWGVIFEFVKKIGKDRDLQAFSSILLNGLIPAPFQMYYINLRNPNPTKLLHIIEKTPDEFLRWGFYCKEPPLLKELTLSSKPKSYSLQNRQKILKRLFKDLKQVSVSEYLKALDHSISRQQAHKDLTQFPHVKAISDRRGRRYCLGRGIGSNLKAC